jgi:hypothetical protein
MEWEGSWRPVVAEEKQMSLLMKMAELREAREKAEAMEKALATERAELRKLPLLERRKELADMISCILGVETPSDEQILQVADVLAIEGGMSYAAGASTERAKTPYVKTPLSKEAQAVVTAVEANVTVPF